MQSVICCRWRLCALVRTSFCCWSYQWYMMTSPHDAACATLLVGSWTTPVRHIIIIIISATVDHRPMEPPSIWQNWPQIHHHHRRHDIYITVITELLYWVAIVNCYYGPGAISDDAVWRLSVAYIGPKSRTERHRKTKIGKEVAHITRLEHLFQGQKVKCQLLMS